jgi:uncharacterized membrane protein YgcG
VRATSVLTREGEATAAPVLLGHSCGARLPMVRREGYHVLVHGLCRAWLCAVLAQHADKEVVQQSAQVCAAPLDATRAASLEIAVTSLHGPTLLSSKRATTPNLAVTSWHARASLTCPRCRHSYCLNRTLHMRIAAGVGNFRQGGHSCGGGGAAGREFGGGGAARRRRQRQRQQRGGGRCGVVWC